MKLIKTQLENIPEHLAIITDGNGRWATRRGLPRSIGHKVGARAIKTITEACANSGVKILTWYVFSIENWKRDKAEVDYLMNLFIKFIRDWREEIYRKGICFRHLGIKSGLPTELIDEIEITEEKTKYNNKMIVNIVLNYSGKAEIVNATHSIVRDVQMNKLRMDDINEITFNNYLYTAGQRDPDFLIRSSGEVRISNFLLWQLSKTQIYTTSVLWPDFTCEHLFEAFEKYKPFIEVYKG
ncbi:di-trans,poly-cis-decaprenylcistransferase [Clostridium sp. D2Q-14]|uniref:polyprenyl diphosphate synthase n=1 Tax=Anaeromonas gelatinilytica TaxID=2683194 RepID=UPI00193BDD73|nr:polyprenyl diphosphate synthase [Anaeromonas gelatinilytica]MBS4535731.1 di-trans,poly-cis-decaprenylcistransferase [Anaeromonas gelatinilytica]